MKQILLAMAPLTSLHSLNMGGNRIKVRDRPPTWPMYILREYDVLEVPSLFLPQGLLLSFTFSAVNLKVMHLGISVELGVLILRKCCALQDAVGRIVTNHPLLEELDLPHAHLGDREAIVLLASIKPMQMLRLVTLTDNHLSDTVLSTLHDELPHILVVFDDIAELHEVGSLDGDGLEDGEELEDGGFADSDDDSGADSTEPDSSVYALEEVTDSEANSSSDTDTDY